MRSLCSGCAPSSMQINETYDDIKHRWTLAMSFVFIVLSVIFLFALSGEKEDAIVPVSVNHFTDLDNAMNLQGITELPSNKWQPASHSVNLGYANHAHWFSANVAIDKQSNEFLLEIDYPLLDNLDIWFFEDRNAAEPLSHFSLGDARPFSHRPIAHETFIVPIPASDTGTLHLVLKVQTEGTVKLPMRIWQKEQFIEQATQVHLLAGLLFGILSAMALSNFFFFLTTRKSTFLFYAGFVVSFVVALLAIQGYAYEFVWPNSPWLQQHGLAMFANATVAFALFFTNGLLNLPSLAKNSSRLVKVFAWFFVLNIGLSAILPYQFVVQLFLVILLIVAIAVFVIVIRLASKGNSTARYYMLAWLLMLLASLVIVLDNFDIVQLALSANKLLFFGAIAQTSYIALVLAQSFGRQRDELLGAQQLALAKEREAAETREKMLAVEQEAKDDLTYKVQERTLELEITLRELSEANQELERLNTVDPLTGLKNRRHFDKRLIAEGRRSRREQTTLSLVMIDVDHFKRVNDDYGHDVGDQCLIHVGKIARSLIKRPSDDICRYGGEEFVLILPNTSADGAKDLTEHLRKAVDAAPFFNGDIHIKLTISAGVASEVIQMDGGEREVLKRADEALYAAKQKGRNMVIQANDRETNATR